MTREVDELHAALDALRAGFLKKLAGLSEADARRSTVDSGTDLAGLLQHLTFVESKWFEQHVAGGKAKGNRSMQVDPALSLQTLRSEYRAACEKSNEIITGIGDADAPIEHEDEAARNLRSSATRGHRRDGTPCGSRRHHPRTDRRSDRPLKPRSDSIAVEGDLDHVAVRFGQLGGRGVVALVDRKADIARFCRT